MNSVYLILVAFSVINIAAGGPLRQQMRMYEEFQMCQGKLTTKVADICNIYHSHPELIGKYNFFINQYILIIYTKYEPITILHFYKENNSFL